MDDGVVVLRLVDGRLPAESWVYAVVAGSGSVLHVGSTFLPPVVRTWLHLEHEDPQVARLRGLDAALLQDAVVVALPVPEGVDRQRVRDLARSRLLAPDDVAPGPAPAGPPATPPPDPRPAVDLSERLRAAVEAL